MNEAGDMGELASQLVAELTAQLSENEQALAAEIDKTHELQQRIDCLENILQMVRCDAVKAETASDAIVRRVNKALNQ